MHRAGQRDLLAMARFRDRRDPVVASIDRNRGRLVRLDRPHGRSRACGGGRGDTARTSRWRARDRLISAANESAVRSCSSLCQIRSRWIRGSSTLTSVFPSASTSATISTPARWMRRSGQATISSVIREKPSSSHCSRSALARVMSTAKCTARISSGASVRAYCSARADARSIVSMNTSTTWRRRMGASAARAASSRSSSASSVYCLLRRSSTATSIGTITMMTHAPCVNFVTAMITSTTNGQERAEAVDEQSGPPSLLLVPEVVAGHSRLRQREAGEHADRVERDEPVDLAVGREDHDDARARQARGSRWRTRVGARAW